MNEFYRELYDNLVRGVEECEKKHTDFRQHIECCFHVCESASLLVDKQLLSAGFKDEEDEIVFFKHIRPKFTSLVEFYSIVYRAELFLPETHADRIEFWKNELQRAELFLDAHRDLHEYIKDEETFRDQEFFLRSANGNSFQGDLIGQTTARELYIELLHKKLGENGV